MAQVHAVPDRHVEGAACAFSLVRATLVPGWPCATGFLFLAFSHKNLQRAQVPFKIKGASGTPVATSDEEQAVSAVLEGPGLQLQDRAG